jgi:hypothetical protein
MCHPVIRTLVSCGNYCSFIMSFLLWFRKPYLAVPMKCACMNLCKENLPVLNISQKRFLFNTQQIGWWVGSGRLNIFRDKHFFFQECSPVCLYCYNGWLDLNEIFNSYYFVPTKLLWDFEAPTFAWQSDHRCHHYALAAPLPPGRFLVLISVRGCVNPRALVWLERLGQLKNPVTTLVIKPVIFCCVP